MQGYDPNGITPEQAQAKAQARVHHGDGDGAMPVAADPGQDFNQFMAMMEADIANLARIIDEHEKVSALLPNRGNMADEAEYDSARHFLSALRVIAGTRRVNREDLRKAGGK